MKTKITVDSNNVTVERDDPFTGERSISRISPRTCQVGNPLRSHSRFRWSLSAVCEKLYSTGDTLMATPETLPAVIRGVASL